MTTPTGGGGHGGGGGGGGGRGRGRIHQSYNNRHNTAPTSRQYNHYENRGYQQQQPPPLHDSGSNYGRDDGDDGNSVNKRLQKKPEQQYYVPKKLTPNHPGGVGGAGSVQSLNNSPPSMPEDHPNFKKRGQQNHRGVDDFNAQRHRNKYQQPPQQPNVHSIQQQQTNEFRGNSEPRIVGDNQQWNYNSFSNLRDANESQRQRDTRSVEPNLMREKKPPSGVIGVNGSGNGNNGNGGAGGRRNSTSDNPMQRNGNMGGGNVGGGNNGGGGGRYPSNLPPRLIKKYMQEDNNFVHKQQQSNWSQTLPRNHGGRGRGRISNSRPETPVDSYRPRSRSSDVGNDDYDYDRSSSYNNYHYSGGGGGGDYRGGSQSHHQQYQNRNDYRSKDFRSSNRSLNYEDTYSDGYNNYGNRHNNDYHNYRSSNHQSSYNNNYNNDRNNYNKNNNHKKRQIYEHSSTGGLGGSKQLYDDRRKSYNADQEPSSSSGSMKTSINERLSNRAQYQSTEDVLKSMTSTEGDVEHLAKDVAAKMTMMTSPEKLVDGKLDWSAEVELAHQELQRPYRSDKPKNFHDESYNSGGQQPRRRHRSKSNSKRRSGNFEEDSFQHSLPNTVNSAAGHDERDSFKMPLPKTYRNRSRRNSQTSMGMSRESSEDRSFNHQRGGGHRKSGVYTSRDNSLDRRDNYMGGQQSHQNQRGGNRSRRSSGRFSGSRETSMERSFWSQQKDENTMSWRSSNERQLSRSKDEAPPSDLNSRNVSSHPQPSMQPLQSPGLIKLPANETRGRDDQHVDELKIDEPKLPSNMQRTLFDPRNPDCPIVINQTQTRNYKTPENVSGAPQPQQQQQGHFTAKASITEQYINIRPTWYDSNSQSYQMVHKKELIDILQKSDMQIQLLIGSGVLFHEWETYISIRMNVQNIQEQFLMNEMKFCQHENVETHFWKLLYHSIIDLLRKYISEDPNPDNKTFYKTKCLEIIESGAKYMDSLMGLLEGTYKFNVNDYIGSNMSTLPSSAQGGGSQQRYVGLALVSAQKILIFSGDLARYKEQINETNNFGRAKQFYTRAQQILPKNGRPYNSLAVLSVISKRKIDAVYFFMRSIMSSNPFQSARESLISLFDETRKKYESTQRKREEKNRARLKEKEHKFGGPLRHETWIHPESGQRIHRTTPLDPETGRNGDTSEEEELEQLDPVELNKRFILSYMHVQGKLITKVGMETFTQCAIQMLREFRALLRHSPIAINSHRLLQLIALNMFAIDCTQLKDPDIAPGARSEIQEHAISIALLMFGIVLKRFVAVIKDGGSPSNDQRYVRNAPVITLGGENVDVHGTTHKKQRPRSQNFDDASNQNLPDISSSSTTTDNIESGAACGGGAGVNEPKKKLILPEDARVMLPAIKIWCDWLRCHLNVWNPPPSCVDFKFGQNSNHDPWNGLAHLMNVLETIDINWNLYVRESKQNYDLIRLQEDLTLAGFTPLLNVPVEPFYCHCDEDVELAQNCLRLFRIIDFCTNVLCTCDPPVLGKNTRDNTRCHPVYISVVQNRSEESSDSEIILESYSDDDSEDVIKSNELLGVKSDLCNGGDGDVGGESSVVISANNGVNVSKDEVQQLLQRKDELEKQHRRMENNKQKLHDILRNSTVSLHIEVRPKYLVPDTNCFVDYLTEIQKIAGAYPTYQLMVPLVVINELEGLSRGNGRATNLQNTSPCNPLALKLDILTSSPPVLSSSSSYNDPEHAIMVAEASKQALAFLKLKTSVKCVTTKGSVLSTSVFTVEDDNSEQISNDDKILITALSLCKTNLDKKPGEVGETRQILREVVLLTTDRNLRVKALSRDLPVRELPDFIKWTKIGLTKPEK